MGAVISLCGTYRYRLDRAGPGEGETTVIMVNPSTADAEKDDATIRKLRGFGERYQWGRIIVGNLFAYRATDVRELATAKDPVGPWNDGYLRQMIENSDRLIFAWGRREKQPKPLRDRYLSILEMAANRKPMSIGAPAKDGHPCHPLMLPYARQPQLWSKP